MDLIRETLNDYKAEIISYVIGAKKGMYPNLQETETIGRTFEIMKEWVNKHYLEK